jgi:hypothetical protein
MTMTALIKFAIGHLGPFLATRDRARVTRLELEDTISADPAVQVLVLDLSGVEAMTVSYADELIGRF